MSTKAAVQFGVRAARIASIMSNPPTAHLFEHTKRFSNNSPNAPATTHLEVERKFNVTPLLLSRLQIADNKNKNTSPDASQEYQTNGVTFSRKSNILINDVYFDCLDLLSSKGIWVRHRTELDLGRALSLVSGAPETTATSTANWEAKIRLGGDYSNSEFEEITGQAEVKKAVERYLSWNDLAESVALSTSRRTWAAQEIAEEGADKTPAELSVVVDNVLSILNPQYGGGKEREFKYSIGELEITRDVELTGDAELDQTKKVETTAKMSGELEQWMKRHDELFPTYPMPVGKLSAFWIWRDNVHD